MVMCLDLISDFGVLKIIIFMVKRKQKPCLISQCSFITGTIQYV